MDGEILGRGCDSGFELEKNRRAGQPDSLPMEEEKALAMLV